ncbi:MAG: RecT family recombinase [Candidatus Thiodiazotropha sp. 6PLUC6]
MNDLTTQQNVLGNMDALERIEKFAHLMATARITIPPELQKNAGDCLALCLQAQAWAMNPFAVAQKAHVIKGKLGYEAQLVNAVITRHAPIEHRPQFTWSDGWERIIGKFRKAPGKSGSGEYAVANWSEKDEEGLWCEVSATMKGEDQPRVLRLLLSQAHPRQSTLWATDPKQQIAYTVMKRWARLHCPDVILGIYTPEELEARSEPEEKDVTPAALAPAARALAAALADGEPSADGEPVTVRTESDSPSARSVTGQYIDYRQDITQDTVTEAPENRAESMKQRVRESMRENAQVVDVPPSDSDRHHRDMCLEMINACTTAKELDEAGELIGGANSALHADFAGEVRKAFRQKKEALA